MSSTESDTKRRNKDTKTQEDISTVDEIHDSINTEGKAKGGIKQGNDDAISPSKSTKMNNPRDVKCLEERASYVACLDDGGNDDHKAREKREVAAERRRSYLLGYLNDDDNDDDDVKPQEDKDVFQQVHQLPCNANDDDNDNDAVAVVVAAETENPQTPGAYLGAPGQRLRRRSDVISTTSFDHDLERQTSLASPRPGSHHSHHQGESRPSDHGISNSNLAVATEVMDESLRLAEAVDPAELEEQATSVKKKDHKCFLMGLFLLAVVLAAFLFGTGVGISIRNKNKEVTPAPSSTSIPTSIPPSETPSSAPSHALDLLMEGLPAYTLGSLVIFGSPQWKAMDWLESHPYITGMEEWRKKQLFALATFFYSMSGENWPDVVKSNWLLYGTPECLWFDNALGEFNQATGIWEEIQFYGNRTICNEQNEFQLLDLVDLDLGGYKPSVPPEIALLTSLELFSLPKNDIDAPLADLLPSQMFGIPNVTNTNSSSAGQLSSNEDGLGMTNSLKTLYLYSNKLNGYIPSEMGRMYGIEELLLSDNSLTGKIPSELGMMEKASFVWWQRNLLTGDIPSELMQMTNVRELTIGFNSLSGSVPSEVALLTKLEHLGMENNALTGTVPLELESFRVNGSLTTLTLANNLFSGSIPEGLCSMGLFNEFVGGGLSFDCNDQLCGCCWCPCPGSNYSAKCETNPLLINRDEEFPGAFPLPLNRTNAITINIRTDGYPEENYILWSVQDESGSWKVLESQSPNKANGLNGYTFEVASNSVYKLTIYDDIFFADGTCCGYGYGWFTITNSTPSSDYVDGTVIWEAAGYELEYQLEVILSINAAGHSQLEASLN